MAANVAIDISKAIANGDVFSIVHGHSTKSNYYDKKYDNEHNDGYYRNLSITIYNESEIARAKGKEIDPDLYNRLSSLPEHHSIKPTRSSKIGMPNSSGCGCLIILISGLTLATISLISVLMS